MRRVYAVFFLRELASSLWVKAAALAVLVAASALVVSVADVFANMPGVNEPAALYGFFTYAFLQTEYAVQALALGIAVLTAFIGREVAVRAVRQSRHIPLAFARMRH